MNLLIEEDEEYEARLQEWTERYDLSISFYRKHYPYRWKAEVEDFPFCTEWNPLGTGITRKEAIANLIKSLEGAYKEIGEFISQLRKEDR